MNPKTIITELRRINAWRRGDETVGQPAPGHFGDVLDAAAESLASLVASNTTLRRERREARAELKQRKADATRMEEYLRNSGRNMDEAQEQIAGRDSKIVTLSADLARVTVERQNWKEWAEEARAMFHKQIDAAAVMKTRAEQTEQRNAELVAALDDLLGCPTVTDLATCPNGDPSRIDESPEWQAVLQISCAWTRYKKLKVLARAESATPDKHPDTKRLEKVRAALEEAKKRCAEDFGPDAVTVFAIRLEGVE